MIMEFYVISVLICFFPLASCECERTFKSNFGDIKFPRLGNGDAYCGKFTFNVNNPDKNPIILTFTEFNLPNSPDCEQGYVEIIEDIHVALGSGERLCGHVLPRPIIVVSGICQLNVILNDNSTRSTFFAEFNECEDCVEKITKSSGEIKYHLNPEDDTTGTDKLYVIENPTKEPIQLKFNEFHLDESKYCMFEYLQIRNGTSLNSPTLATLCGKLKPDPITVKTGKLTLIFHSEEPYAKHGFSIRFTNASQTISGLFTTTLKLIRKDQTEIQTTDFYFEEATKVTALQKITTSDTIMSDENSTIAFGDANAALPIASETREKTGFGDSLSKTAVTIIGTVASAMLLTFSVAFIILWTRRRSRQTRRSERGYGRYQHSLSLRGPYDLKKSKEQEVNVIYNANFSNPNPVPKINSSPCVITNIENLDSHTPSVITSVGETQSKFDFNIPETIGNAGRDIAIEDGLHYSFMLTSKQETSDENRNIINGVYLDNINDKKGFYQAL